MINIERKLGFNNRPVPKDIYERLKLLEDKIEYLEGMSPEYFNIGIKNVSKNEHDYGNANSIMRQEENQKSLSAINTRIQELQASLKVKNEPMD